MSKTLTSEEQRKRMAEHIWLTYYNDYLFQQGIITEDVRNRMKIKIDLCFQGRPADPYLYSGLLRLPMIKYGM